VDVSRGVSRAVEAEERGQGLALSPTIFWKWRDSPQVLLCDTGEGGVRALPSESGDKLIMLENAYFSVISPGGLRGPILWKDCSRAQESSRNAEAHCPGLEGARLHTTRWLPERKALLQRRAVAMARVIRRCHYERLDELSRYSSAQAYRKAVAQGCAGIGRICCKGDICKGDLPHGGCKVMRKFRLD